MSNNNNAHNTIYNKVGHGADDDEMEMLINSTKTSHQVIGSNQMTTINIENEMAPGTSQQHLQQIRRDVDSTRINMETNGVNRQIQNSGENSIIDDRHRMPNLFAMLREARQQLNRSQSLRDNHPSPSGENSSSNTHARSWRENLYEVLSSPVSPRAHTSVLRAIFTPSSSANIRYDSLPSNALHSDDQLHFILNHNGVSQTEREFQSNLRSQHSNSLEIQSSSVLRLSRQNSRLTDDRSLNEISTTEPQACAVDTSTDSTGGIGGNNRRQSITASSVSNRILQRQNSVAGSTTAPTVDMIDDVDTNAVGEIIVKFVNDFIRYLPFIFIIFLKFILDHLLSILDILILHGVLYQINKSLKEQVAKLNQKSFTILVRDLILVLCVVTYRFILSNSTPDPFGLLINPPGSTITLDLLSTQKAGTIKEASSDVPINIFAKSEHQIYEVPSSAATNSFNSTISVTKTISLGTLLYYVAVNDLILKLLTQLIKIMVTMFPSKVINHKSRARLYALIENVSQFYRALVPIRQWLSFLFDSSTDFKIISGVLFSSFYVGAKLFDLFGRGRPLKQALINFVRNMDYERKPTKDELEAVGTVCPICHDSFSAPVVLECGHIFCDECVNTWFKREQTCPMCRAQVSEDPTWQDGATTYFYQLC